MGSWVRRGCSVGYLSFVLGCSATPSAKAPSASDTVPADANAATTPVSVNASTGMMVPGPGLSFDTIAVDFAKNSTVMSTEAKRAADAAAQTITSSPGVNGVAVTGRNDQDDPAKAAALSTARTKAVVAYLVKRGVVATLFTAVVPADVVASMANNEEMLGGLDKKMGTPAPKKEPGVDITLWSRVAADVAPPRK